MKKGLKKISGLILSLVLLFTSFSNVSAYDYQTLDDYVDHSHIVMNYILNKDKPYISLTGDLKGKNAKVYQQIVEIKGGASDFAKLNDYQERMNNGDNTVYSDFTALIPSFVDDKWSEVSYTSTVENEDRYNAKLPINSAPDYFVVWVKVTYEEAGETKTYYNYNFYCIDNIAKPVCSIVNDKYYDENGEETTKEKYIEACTCRVTDGKYYDDNGDEVDEATYKKACFACTVEDGKYYNDKGEEVTEEAYKKACLPICTEENGVYYDNNGNAVSKDVYNKKCSNPTTGNQIYYVYGVSTIGVAFVLYMFTRKVRKFSK